MEAHKPANLDASLQYKQLQLVFANIQGRGDIRLSDWRNGDQTVSFAMGTNDHEQGGIGITTSNGIAASFTVWHNIISVSAYGVGGPMSGTITIYVAASAKLEAFVLDGEAFDATVKFNGRDWNMREPIFWQF